MSEQEKLKAVAKVKAKIYRRLLTALVVAPVFICGALAILAPTIRMNLAQREAGEFCGTQIPQLDNDTPLYTISITDVEDSYSDIVITNDNISQLTQLDNAIIAPNDLPSASRFQPALMHPNGDFVIFADQRESSTIFFICGMDKEALGAFSVDAIAGQIDFNADASLFTVTERQNGTLTLFDAETITQLEVLTYDAIHSVTFHPSEPLVVFTADGDLIVYNTDTMTQIYQETLTNTFVQAQLSFNVDGTSLFIINTLTGAPTATVWGIAE